jgi:hypothetical protein
LGEVQRQRGSVESRVKGISRRPRLVASQMYNDPCVQHHGIERQFTCPRQRLNAEIIAAAIEGFELQKRRIDTQIGELRAMLSGSRSEGAATPEATTPKRKVSAAARRRMAQGQKKRWAARKAESQGQASATPEPAKPKRQMSAAGRRAISEATKRRWALKRAETANAQLGGVKKAALQKTTAKKTAKKASTKAAKKTTARGTGHVAASESVAQ